MENRGRAAGGSLRVSSGRKKTRGSAARRCRRPSPAPFKLGTERLGNFTGAVYVLFFCVHLGHVETTRGKERKKEMSDDIATQGDKWNLVDEGGGNEGGGKGRAPRSFRFPRFLYRRRCSATTDWELSPD